MRKILGTISTLLIICTASIQTVLGLPLEENQSGSHPFRNQPDTSPELSSDDPLVHASTPPPAGTKPITKVGWCEVQIFGHTFSDPGLIEVSLPVLHMHLPARLEQLNKKLNFEPGKSGLQLMDNIDALVKFVYANKKSAASKGASLQAPVAPAK